MPSGPLNSSIEGSHATTHSILRDDAGAPAGAPIPRYRTQHPALPRCNRERLSLPTRCEIGQALRSDFPHLYGTAPELRFLPWGQGTDAGYKRAGSNNSEVALRGIALWLAVAYHETKNSPHASLQLQHWQVMQLLRELKKAHSGGHTVDSWMNETAAG